MLRPALAARADVCWPIRQPRPTTSTPERTRARTRTVGTARLFARLVKVEHTIFALPFAYVGALLAVDGVPSAHDLLWITVAMVGARSLAMALNRLIDAGIDARNPRTAGRELPSGRAHVVGACRAFCAASLARLPRRRLAARPDRALALADPGRRRSSIYPYLKRFTWLCHLWLGAVDGLAPVGAWVAITGKLPWQAWALGGAVATWVAGFDLFYSLFDVEIDRAQGLHSWATRFGERGAFVGRARCCTSRRSRCSSPPGLGLPVDVWYWLGVAVVAGLLAYEHSLVRPGDLRRLDAAFFTMNGVISVAFFVFVLVDVL